MTSSPGCVAEVLQENKSYLTDLDSAIGDADHGINMDRGFTAVLDKLARAGQTRTSAPFSKRSA